MKKLILISFAVLFNTLLFAQNGLVTGIITDKSNEEPIIGGSVQLQGTVKGASTDINGNFEFSAPQGKYVLLVSYIGYKDFKQEIEVTDQPLNLTILLDPDLLELEGVIIESRKDRTTEEVLAIERKKATLMVEKVGAVQLSKQGVSNVEEGLAKMAGISKVGSKGVFVRGLGDRYNNVFLNGLLVASPDPNRKSISLGLIPTNVVENLSVSKVFSPRFYGDFAGASINVTTKSYSEDPFLTVGLSSSANSMVSFKEVAMAKDGDHNYFGYNGGGRFLPAEVENKRLYKTIKENPSSPFGTDFDSNRSKAPMNQGFNMTGGFLKDVGSDQAIGVLASVSYGNKYSYTDGVTKQVNASGDVKKGFDFERYRFETNISSLANIYFKINDQHELNYNFVYIHGSQNGQIDWDGEDNDQGKLFKRRLEYTENQMTAHQLRGLHQMEEDRLEVNWAGSYSEAYRDILDRKELTYSKISSSYYINTLNNSNNHRYFEFSDDKNLSGKLDVSYLLGGETVEEYTLKLAVGGQGNKLEREAHWRQINLVMDKFDNAGLNVDLDPNNTKAFINESNFSNGLLSYKEQGDPSRDFFGKLDVYAAYALAEYKLIPEKLIAEVGVRFEYTNRSLRYKKLGDLFAGEFRESVYDTVSYLPSLSMKYTLDEQQSLRFAVSKTLTRPSFREVLPIQFAEDPTSLTEGNPNLKISSNYNFDLKYELYPENGGLLSAGLFARYIQDAIERIVIPTSESLFSFENSESATVAGIELEANMPIVTTGFDVGANMTLLYSQIKLNDENNFLTNSERPLQGASPYLANATVSYSKPFSESWVPSWSLIYNVFGKRVYAVGAQKIEDQYEQTYHTVDLILRNKIADKLSVNLSVKNLLNPRVKRTQEVDGKDIIVNSYKNGMSVGVSLSYTL